MPKPYDAVSKNLIDRHPAEWLKLVGAPAGSAEPIEVEFLDTDLSTVTSQSDRVLKVNTPTPRLYHIELESGHHGARTPMNLLLYNVLLRVKHELPVDTFAVLLTPEADSPALKRPLLYHNHSGDVALSFKFGVLRVWELSVEELLTGGIGTLPLAPLSNVPTSDLPGVIQRMQSRIDAETSAVESRELWTATKILMGLRVPPAAADDLLKGVRQMRESSTYQAILQEGEAIGEAKGEARGRAEGRAEEARSVILRLGRKGCGAPRRGIKSKIDAITSIERLERIQERLLEAETWDDLLGE